MSIEDKRLKTQGLHQELIELIDNGRVSIARNANKGLVLLFWQIGKRINEEILKGERAEYGKKVVENLATELQAKYGATFNKRNINWMLQFAAEFSNIEIVNSLGSQLSWTHIRTLLTLKSHEARLYYANEVIESNLGVRGLKKLIDRKAYERQSIADSQLSKESLVPFNSFKDPYLLDALGLKDNFLEADLEKAILHDIEKFILEFGNGFAFMERQKKIVFDNEDYYVDLLFYHRPSRRLVAVELKKGKFKAEYKGQMEFYLRWLNQNEKLEGEQQPIGLILCSEASRAQIELLEMDKAGIAVSEFWTTLPKKEQFEKKINEIVLEAQERIERRKQLGSKRNKKQIEYFYEPDNED